MSIAYDREKASILPVTMDVIMRQTTGRSLAGASLMLLSALLAGCGLLGDGATNAFVAPGKFEYHNCDHLAETGRSLSARERELAELMARAAQGPGGKFVGEIAYHTELMQTRGQLKQIADVAERKNCASQSKWKSDRALW